MSLLDRLRLSYEGSMPALSGATAWLNSEPVTAGDFEGHVAMIDFWTFTCINWIRTAPFRRAWDERYREHGLTIIGVHTPEFPFETDVDSIRAAIDGSVGRRSVHPPPSLVPSASRSVRPAAKVRGMTACRGRRGAKAAFQ
jgi:thiol-disulfide isomerase/thioredoxin